jgi:ankyrin repeat protein
MKTPDEIKIAAYLEKAREAFEVALKEPELGGSPKNFLRTIINLARALNVDPDNKEISEFIKNTIQAQLSTEEFTGFIDELKGMRLAMSKWQICGGPFEKIMSVCHILGTYDMRGGNLLVSASPDAQGNVELFDVDYGKALTHSPYCFREYIQGMFYDRHTRKDYYSEKIASGELRFNIHDYASYLSDMLSRIDDDIIEYIVNRRIVEFQALGFEPDNNERLQKMKSNFIDKLKALGFEPDNNESLQEKSNFIDKLKNHITKIGKYAKIIQAIANSSPKGEDLSSDEERYVNGDWIIRLFGAVDAYGGDDELDEFIKYMGEHPAPRIWDKNTTNKFMSMATLSDSKAISIIQFLIKNPTTHLNYQNGDKESILMILASYSKLDTMKILFSRMPSMDVDLIDKDGRTALIVAAEYDNIVEFLVEKKANLDIQDKKGNTALMIAAANGNLKSVTILVENGASVNLQNVDENTALMQAIMCENQDLFNIELIKFLIDNGADQKITNKKGERAKDLALIAMERILPEDAQKLAELFGIEYKKIDRLLTLRNLSTEISYFLAKSMGRPMFTTRDEQYEIKRLIKKIYMFIKRAEISSNKEFNSVYEELSMELQNYQKKMDEITLNQGENIAFSEADVGAFFTIREDIENLTVFCTIKIEISESKADPIVFWGKLFDQLYIELNTALSAISDEKHLSDIEKQDKQAKYNDVLWKKDRMLAVFKMFFDNMKINSSLVEKRKNFEKFPIEICCPAEDEAKRKMLEVVRNRKEKDGPKQAAIQLYHFEQAAEILFGAQRTDEIKAINAKLQEVLKNPVFLVYDDQYPDVYTKGKKGEDLLDNFYTALIQLQRLGNHCHALAQAYNEDNTPKRLAALRKLVSVIVDICTGSGKTALVLEGWKLNRMADRLDLSKTCLQRTAHTFLLALTYLAKLVVDGIIFLKAIFKDTPVTRKNKTQNEAEKSEYTRKGIRTGRLPTP